MRDGGLEPYNGVHHLAPCGVWRSPNVARWARKYMLAGKNWPKQRENLIAYIREFVFRARS